MAGKYPKLVRDKIPEIIAVNEGVPAETQIVSGEEYDKYLRQKLEEEAAEVAGAQGSAEVAEELADLLEVADALMAVHGLERSLVEEVRLKKREKRGGFDKGIVLLRLP